MMHWLYVGLCLAAFCMARAQTNVAEDHERTRIEVRYRVIFDKRESVWLRAGSTLYRWFGGRYARLRVATERHDAAKTISVYDADENPIGHLASDPAQSFLYDPEESRLAAFSPKALAKLHSLFAFALAGDARPGDQLTIMFPYVNPESGERTHHAIIVKILREEQTPFVDVPTRLYGQQFLRGWRVAIWALKSNTGPLDEGNWRTQGKPNMYAEGLIARESAMRGAILALHVRAIRGDKEYFLHLAPESIEVSEP